MPRKQVRYAVVGLGHIAQVAVLPAFGNARRNSRLAALVSGLAAALPAMRDRWRRLAPAALAALVCLPAVVETRRSHPDGLSHYNLLAGGFAGGATLGMNRQYWGYSVAPMLPRINDCRSEISLPAAAVAVPVKLRTGIGVAGLDGRLGAVGGCPAAASGRLMRNPGGGGGGAGAAGLGLATRMRAPSTGRFTASGNGGNPTDSYNKPTEPNCT